MNEFPSDHASSYSVVIIRENGTRLTLESRVAKKRAQRMQIRLREFFREVLIVPQSLPAVANASI